MAKILIVEDEKTIADSLVEWLQDENHLVEAVHNGSDGLDRLRFYSYDLIILDWQLPQASGIELVKEYRLQGGKSPVLMLTAKKLIDDKELGLEAGADDYLTKPFDLRELSARVKALLRRPSAYVEVRRNEGFGLDPKQFLFLRGHDKIKLLPKEFAVMEFLMRHPRQYFSPEEILNHVWSDESDSSVEALRTCISRMRQKIDLHGTASMLQSARGCGYKFEPPENAIAAAEQPQDLDTRPNKQ